MSSQVSILRFLKRSSAETSSSLDPPKAKNNKPDDDSTLLLKLGENNSSCNSLAISKDRAQINRSVAELKLRLPISVKRLIREMNSEWCYLLSTTIMTESFTKLANFIEEERSKFTIYPPQSEVFAWSKLTPPNRVRVVILGQDPYHGPQQAHGLAFSVKRPQRPPPSLVNMYKEIASDCTSHVPSSWPPDHGDLTRWAEQGVLLLNTVLTVRAFQPNSHKNQGWEQLTSAVVNHINNFYTHVVFLLWGANAQAQGKAIDRKKHLVLDAAHPSPLSANRGFFGCQHFSKANAYLKDHGLAPINWTDLS